MQFRLEKRAEPSRMMVYLTPVAAVVLTMILGAAIFSLIGQLAYLRRSKTRNMPQRFSNNMIRIFDENEDLLETYVKPILRNTIKKYDLDIELKNSTGADKNTQILGRDVINKLKTIKK